MAVTKFFTEAVASGDVIGVRIMMKDSLLVDLTFRDFNEMLRLAGNMPGLYDKHDDRAFVLDKNIWDDAYMNQLMTQVVGNFSHDRLEHLKQVVRYLRPVPESAQSAQHTQPARQKAENHKAGHTDSRTSEKDRCAPKYENERGRKIVKIVGGTIAGAVVLVVSAAVVGAASEAVAVCAAAGAAAGATVGGTIAARHERSSDE